MTNPITDNAPVAAGPGRPAAAERLFRAALALTLVASALAVLLNDGPCNDVASVYARQVRELAAGRWAGAFFHMTPPLVIVLAGLLAKLAIPPFAALKIVSGAFFVAGLWPLRRLLRRALQCYSTLSYGSQAVGVQPSGCPEDTLKRELQLRPECHPQMTGRHRAQGVLASEHQPGGPPHRPEPRCGSSRLVGWACILYAVSPLVLRAATKGTLETAKVWLLLWVAVAVLEYGETQGQRWLLAAAAGAAAPGHLRA